MYQLYWKKSVFGSVSGLAVVALIVWPMGASAAEAQTELVSQQLKNLPDQGFFNWMVPPEQLSRMTKSTETVIARGQDSASDDMLLQAHRFLAARAQQLKIPDPVEELILHQQNADRQGNHHLRFFHQIDGVRIGDTEMIVHLNRQGEVVAFNGYLEAQLSQLRTRLRDHLADRGLRLQRRDVQRAISLDLSGDRFQINQIHPRIDTKRAVVYWLVEVNRPNGVETLIYRIADHPSAEVLSKESIVKSFLPIFEQPAADQIRQVNE